MWVAISTDSGASSARMTSNTISAQAAAPASNQLMAPKSELPGWWSMLITKYCSRPSTPVRFRSLHSMMMAASNSPSTRSATRIEGTPGNAINAGGAASWFTTSTCLPSARSANAIASCEPMESPSGRECELITNRWRARIASQMRAIGPALLFAIVWWWGILCGPRVVRVDLLQQLLDARLVGDRLVEHERDFRHPSQAQPLRELSAHERCHALQRFFGGPLSRSVAQSRVVDVGNLQVGADTHPRDGHEPHPGIVDIAREHVAGFRLDLLAQPLGPRRAHARNSTSLRDTRPGSTRSISSSAPCSSRLASASDPAMVTTPSPARC